MLMAAGDGRLGLGGITVFIFRSPFSSSAPDSSSTRMGSRSARPRVPPSGARAGQQSARSTVRATGRRRCGHGHNPQPTPCTRCSDATSCAHYQLAKQAYVARVGTPSREPRLCETGGLVCAAVPGSTHIWRWNAGGSWGVMRWGEARGAGTRQAVIDGLRLHAALGQHAPVLALVEDDACVRAQRAEGVEGQGTPHGSAALDLGGGRDRAVAQVQADASHIVRRKHIEGAALLDELHRRNRPRPMVRIVDWIVARREAPHHGR